MNKTEVPVAEVEEPTSRTVVRLVEQPLWPALVEAHRRFREDRLGMTAGSLTFTTLISLVPLLTVMLALFTAFPMFSAFQVALEKYFLKSLIPDTIAKPVLASLTQFASKATRLGTIGLVLLGISALALMFTIDRTLNQIWRVQRPRPLAYRVLVYWAALTLGPLLVGASLSLTSYAITASEGLVGGLPAGLGLVLNSLDVAFLALAMAGLFRYVPNTDVRWRHALLGAVFVALAFSLAKSGLAWYVRQVPTFKTMYGAFSVVPILLVWIYLGWVIVLLGAMLAANAPSVLGQLKRRPARPGLELSLALEVVQALWAQQERGAGLSFGALARQLRIDPLQLEPVVDGLIDIDWVGRLDEDGAKRLVLLCQPERTPAAPLLALHLAEQGPGLTRLWAASRWHAMPLSALVVDHGVKD